MGSTLSFYLYTNDKQNQILDTGPLIQLIIFKSIEEYWFVIAIVM